ncbi:MAG TPA: hypothetical protein VF820_03680, partial [Patescibacteria group bacterium]
MSTAVLIPFFRYQPHYRDYYRIYFEQLLKGLEIWGDEFDKLYLIDQDMEFTTEDFNRLLAVKPNSEIIKSVNQGHHWVQFKDAIPHIKEDRILFLDNDVIIWKKGIVKKWLENEVALTFDGSGGLKAQMQEKFPILKKYDATRMGSYYFVLPKKVFEKIPDFDFAPITYEEGTYLKELGYTTQKGDWSDSFGLFTMKLLSLYPEVGFIEDDRSSISFPDNKTSNPRQLGYYHVRNGNLPIYTINSFYTHPEDYTRTLKITPIS